MAEQSPYDARQLDEVAAARVQGVLDRLPARPRQALERLLARWLGRTLIRAAAAFLRVELFDRAMAIAAQFFSSILPILILAATLAGSSQSDAVARAIGVPDSSTAMVDNAVAAADTAAFGVVGALLVLASATSLSRALTRVFAAIWEVPRPRTGLGSAWRWLAVVIVLAVAVVLGHALGEQTKFLPPREVWPVLVSFAADILVAAFVPWVLLAGRLAGRLLVPGAVLFALVMLVVRPASEASLPHALEISSNRYGPIGLAFAYLAWLYVVSFIFVATAVLGQVLTTDRGRLGAWARGPRAAAPEATRQ